MTTLSPDRDSKPTDALPPSSVEPTMVGDSSQESFPDASQSSSAPSLPVFTAGTQMGRFRIERLLGKGAMGSVYLAFDPELNRTVALKIPNATGKLRDEIIERFVREARFAAKLNHPNICPVYEVGEQDGTRFLAMGYIDGRPLSDFIRPGKLQPERPIALAVRKIALAVHEAHCQGLIHRDLKPGNIMIDGRREPIVMDFGLAKLVDDDSQTQLTQEGIKVGTPSYMSPEQIEGDGVLGPASDVFSLGVILYEMLTTSRPFQGSVINVIGQILHKEPEPILERRPDLSPQLAAICTKALAKNPADRFASMKEFADALGDFLKVKPGRSSLVLKSYDSQDALRSDGDESKPRKSSRRLIVLGGIAMLFLVAAIFDWMHSHQPAATTITPAELISTPISPAADDDFVDEMELATADEEPAMEAEPDTEPQSSTQVVSSEPTLDPYDEPIDALLAVETEMADSNDDPQPTPEPKSKSVAKTPEPQPKRPAPPPPDPNFRPPPGGPDIDAEMDKFDLNRDGVLTKDELPPHVFVKADRNKDGKVSKGELAAAHRRYKEKLHAPPGSQPAPRTPGF